MGFAAGFQVGSQAVERALKRRDEEQLKQQLAEVYKAPTSGLSYTSDQMAEMRRRQAEGAYDIEAVPGAEGQTPTLRYTPKQGLDYGDLGPAAPTEFAPQQVQMYGGQSVAGQFDPMTLQGLRAREAARVVGASGDYRGAAQLEADAIRMEREAKEAPLRLKGLEQQVTLGGQQIETGTLTLAEKRRQEETAKREADFTKFASQNPNLSVADLKEAAFKQFGYSPQQWEKAVTSRLNIDTAEMAIFKKGVQAKLKGKNLSQAGELYNTDPDFDDKTDLAIVPGKGGAVTLNFIDKATKKITGTQTFKNEALALEYLNKQATEPENLGTWMLNLAKVEAAIDASAASATKDRAIGAAYGIEKTKAFDPEKYAKTVKALTDAGLPLVDARIQADQMYGRGPKDNVDADLQEQNKNKGKTTAATDKKTTPEMSQAQARLKIINDTIATLRQNTGLANPNRVQNAAALAILEQQRADLQDSLRISGTFNEDVGLRTMPMARP